LSTLALSSTAARIAAGTGSRRNRRLAVLLLLALAAVAMTAHGLVTGAVVMPLGDVARAIGGILAGGGAVPAAEAVESHVVLALRLPRVLMGLLVGATLAVSGAALQGLLRNPLADPGLVGVTAGASVGAVAVIVLGAGFLPFLPPLLRPLALPIGAFAAGLVTTLVVYRLARDDGATHVAVLLLAGIAINAMAAACIGFGIFVADDRQLRDFQFWTLGSLAGASWPGFWLPAMMMLVSIAGLWRLAGGLNGLALGEGEAVHLGFAVERIKRRLILFVALGVGSTVAVAGAVGFVGLVVPHLARLLIGLDHRWLMPATAALGGGLLVLADSAARVLVLPAELPLGIITAAVGGPFFLALLLANRRRLSL
jgi:iron complex transport system permease protein